LGARRASVKVMNDRCPSCGARLEPMLVLDHSTHDMCPACGAIVTYPTGLADADDDGGIAADVARRLDAIARLARLERRRQG